MFTLILQISWDVRNRIMNPESESEKKKKSRMLDGLVIKMTEEDLDIVKQLHSTTARN